MLFSQHQNPIGLNALGFFVPGLGATTTSTLPGFEGTDVDVAIANIGESVWNVLGNLLYIAGAAADGSDMVENGRAGRITIENYFKSQVNPQDVINGNSMAVNAAANATAQHFLHLFNGPRPATGVAPGDWQGSCMAYSVGPSSFYAAQVPSGGQWSPQQKCAQLAALIHGSGLDWISVALGGDGVGGAPVAANLQTQAEIDRSSTAAQQAAIDSAWAQQQQAGAMFPTGAAVQPGVPISPYAAGQNNVVMGPNGPVWVGGGGATSVTASSAVVNPASTNNPIVQAIGPQVYQPMQYDAAPIAAPAPATVAVPSPSPAATATAASSLGPSSNPLIATAQQPLGANPTQTMYAPMVPGVIAPATATSGDTVIGGVDLTTMPSWVLPAAAAAVLYFLMKGKGQF